MKKQTKSQENASEINPEEQKIDPAMQRLINEIELICDGEDINYIIGALSFFLGRMIVVAAIHSNNINYIEDFIKQYELYLFKYACHYKKFHVN